MRAIIKKIIAGSLVGIGIWGSAFISSASFLGDIVRWVMFDLNPMIIITCDIFNSNKCIGLGFDGGPLEWAEYLWFWTTPLVFVVVGVALAFAIDWVWRQWKT